MSHVDLNLGVFYPTGGMAGVAQAIGRLAESVGVKIVTGQPVRRIDVKAGRARGVETDDGIYPADSVVINADYAHAETSLLDERYRSFTASYWKKRVWAPSMFILYLGLNRRLSSLAHHNLYFAPDWMRHFDTIFASRAWPDDPCFYISCISKTDRDAAPEGGENVFVLVPVAPGLDDSSEQRERYADQVLKHVERVTGERIEDAIRVRRIYSHRDFTADYNAYEGTALGLAHTLSQTAIFRPSMQSRRVRDLYYTGQYTHPGVGVPMVLISAHIVAEQIGKTLEPKPIADTVATGGIHV
jgi:phytoene desaturase